MAFTRFSLDLQYLFSIFAPHLLYKAKLSKSNFSSSGHIPALRKARKNDDVPIKILCHRQVGDTWVVTGMLTKVELNSTFVSMSATTQAACDVVCDAGDQIFPLSE